MVSTTKSGGVVSFFHLPLEVRELVYEYAFEPTYTLTLAVERDGTGRHGKTRTPPALLEMDSMLAKIPPMNKQFYAEYKARFSATKERSNNELRARLPLEGVFHEGETTSEVQTFLASAVVILNDRITYINRLIQALSSDARKALRTVLFTRLSIVSSYVGRFPHRCQHWLQRHCDYYTQEANFGMAGVRHVILSPGQRFEATDRRNKYMLLEALYLYTYLLRLGTIDQVSLFLPFNETGVSPGHVPEKVFRAILGGNYPENFGLWTEYPHLPLKYWPAEWPIANVENVPKCDWEIMKTLAQELRGLRIARADILRVHRLLWGPEEPLTVFTLCRKTEPRSLPN